jgi:hypothetical protein
MLFERTGSSSPGEATVVREHDGRHRCTLVARRPA